MSTGDSAGGGSSGGNERRWGDTTSKRGEISRVFIGNIPHSTVCDELGML